MKNSADERNDYLEGEVVRLAARCKELVEASEITNEVLERAVVIIPECSFMVFAPCLRGE